MKKLPKKFKEKWIAALRSGEYEQGTGELYNKKLNSFCCLGIAGVIAGISLEDLNSKTYLGDDYEWHVKNKNVPECLMRHGAKELSKSNPEYLQVAKMNDQGKSFTEIADWIEENL